MEKHGKIRLVEYNDEETVTAKHCIILDRVIYISFIETYDGTILVSPELMPQWLIAKIKQGLINRNDNVIVTIKHNGEPLIEKGEAVIELPKLWSHSVDELFEKRYTSSELKGVLEEYTNRLTDLFESGISTEAKIAKRDEILAEFHKKYKLPDE